MRTRSSTPKPKQIELGGGSWRAGSANGAGLEPGLIGATELDVNGGSGEPERGIFKSKMPKTTKPPRSIERVEALATIVPPTESFPDRVIQVWRKFLRSVVQEFLSPILKLPGISGRGFRMSLGTVIVIALAFVACLPARKA